MWSKASGGAKQQVLAMAQLYAPVTHSDASHIHPSDLISHSFAKGLAPNRLSKYESNALFGC